jgi:hypothetical protein
LTLVFSGDDGTETALRREGAGGSRVRPLWALDDVDWVFIGGRVRVEMPEGEGERRREGGGASSRLTYSCLGLRVWLTVDRFPVLEIGEREGCEVDHPVGEEGWETVSPEVPAPRGMAGFERIVTD